MALTSLSTLPYSLDWLKYRYRWFIMTGVVGTDLCRTSRTRCVYMVQSTNLTLTLLNVTLLRLSCSPGSSFTHTQQIGGRWVKGHSAGGCRNNSSYSSNPKFWLRVGEGGEALLSLMQCGPESVRQRCTQWPPGGSGTRLHPHYQAIALHLWKVSVTAKEYFRTSSVSAGF